MTSARLRCQAALLVLLALGACTAEPTTYDDCILQKVKAGMDKAVAATITGACRSKFPESLRSKPLTQLPPDAARKIDGRFGVSNFGGSGNIYNGNADWIVEEITILLADPIELKNKIEGKEMSQSNAARRMERYKVAVTVQPLSSHDFFISVNWPANQKHEWLIVEAKGTRLP